MTIPLKYQNLINPNKMKKLVILIAFVASVSLLGSCTSYTCPTYSLENTQEAPAELAEENL